MTHGKGKAKFEMQDAHAVVSPLFGREGSVLLGVYDGHAGKQCAGRCVELLPERLAEAMAGGRLEDCDDASDALVEAFARADEALRDFEDEGSTATVLVSWPRKGKGRVVQAAGVGDSLAFLCRADGGSEALTVEHKVTTPSERARVEAAGVELGPKATRIPGGLAVSRALGDHFLKTENTGLIGVPDVSPPIQIQKHHLAVIVASDALWFDFFLSPFFFSHFFFSSCSFRDMISGAEACEIIAGMKNESAQAMAEKLLAVASKSTDNATVLIMKFL